MSFSIDNRQQPSLGFDSLKAIEGRLQKIEVTEERDEKNVFEAVDLPDFWPEDVDQLSDEPEMNESEARNLSYLVKVELEKRQTSIVNTEREPLEEVLQQVDSLTDRLKDMDISIISEKTKQLLTTAGRK
jgi:hypothetical protein